MRFYRMYIKSSHDIHGAIPYNRDIMQFQHTFFWKKGKVGDYLPPGRVPQTPPGEYPWTSFPDQSLDTAIIMQRLVPGLSHARRSSSDWQPAAAWRDKNACGSVGR